MSRSLRGDLLAAAARAFALALLLPLVPAADAQPIQGPGPARPPAETFRCFDRAKNGSETDVDCGGDCPTFCAPGQSCNTGTDCESGVCGGQQRCEPPRCDDGLQNGDETGRDCGGTCGIACGCDQRGKCIIFVTSTSYTGKLGGLSGADAICNERAKAAGLVGVYQAWLCDGRTAPATPGRCNQAGVPYLRTDGARIADDWANLTDGSLLLNSINRDEFGTAVVWFVDSLPWTYVTPWGTCDDATYLSPGFGPCPAFHRCKLNCADDGGDNGWTSDSLWAQGAKGDVNLVTTFWTDGATGLCNTPKERIYCIEQ